MPIEVPKNWRAGILLLTLPAILTVFLVRGLEVYRVGEPDTYYHLAISKLEAEHGRLKTLPQVEDLGWGKSFVDKEWLFHVVTTQLYRIGGERGVSWAIPILTTLSLTLLAYAALQLTGPLGLGAATATLLFTHTFVFRLSVLRPHLLSVMLFTLLLTSVLKRNRPMTFLACFLFPLAYHALFVPFGLLGILMAMGFAGAPIWKKFAYWGFSGLILGTLLNPYFPLNLEVMFLQAGIGSDPSLGGGFRAGQELLPLSPFLYFRLYSWLWLVVLAEIFWIGTEREHWRKSPDLQAQSVLALSSAAFLGLTFRSPRAIEYAGPCLLLLAAFLARNLWQSYQARKSKPKLAFLVWAPIVTFAFVWAARPMTEFYSRFGESPGRTVSAYALEALSRLPADSSGTKVYTCEWALGSVILYARPDMRFVDLLDPRFLLFYSPEALINRRKIELGQVDAYETVRDKFKAQYVLCEIPEAIARFKGDTRFELLYPQDAELAMIHVAAPHLFKLR